jgi:type I restriction enzyme S subunit
MFTTRASPQLLGTRRIDPDYYAPTHVADDQRLRQFGAFELGDCGRFFVGPFGSELPSSLYRPSGVPLLRVGNIGQLDMSEDNLVFLDEATHQQLEASETLPGDLLIVKASVGEKICRFPSRYGRGNITQDIIGIRPNGYADMDYVAVALFSPIGRRQLERRSLGSIIQYLGVVDARTVLVPRIAPEAQRYIGDKVRQAERLRERARTLELAAHIATIEMLRHRSNAQDAVRNLLLVISGKQAARLDPVDRSSWRVGALSSRVAPSAMFGRLNAEAYKQEFLDNDRLLRASEWPLTRLGDLVVAPINNSIRGVTEHLSPDGRGVPMFRPADIDGLWMNDASAPRISATFEQEHAKARVQPGDIVLAIAGTVAAVARIGESVMHGNINGSSARVRLQTPRRGFALLFLASPFGQRELMRWAVGSVQKHLNLEDLTEIRIPELPVELCEPFESSLQLSGRSRDGSKGLLAAATTLVEQLIDGRVTEGDLITAQKALEAGDRSADRELLKALRQSGAPDAKPLIADVEALYALLDESEDAR